MRISLLEKRTIINPDGTSYAACLLCDSQAKGRMLCVSHEIDIRAKGMLWQYPGNYLDDYSGEGEDEINSIIDWLFRYDFSVMSSVMDKLGVMWEMDIDHKGKSVGWESPFLVASCSYCLKTFDALIKHEGRGLCVSCYDDLRHNNSHMLTLYPTKRYEINVRGHAHFMLSYHLDRVTAVAGYYGVSVSVSRFKS